jgi:tRNA pseudouridine55 synthase
MREIRTRVSERHGIELSNQQIQELAARRLEAILDPRAIKPALMDELRLAVTAGFYVRSLARDLGERLGCGAHLADLRRTHSGIFDVSTATPLEEAERLGPEMATRLIPPAEALPELPAVHLSDSGLVRARHGNPIGPQFVAGPWVPAGLGQARVRLLDPAGTLVALADLRGGLLHPAVVLG